MVIPQNYSFERDHDLIIGGVEGKTTRTIDDILRDHKTQSRFQPLDYSPLMEQRDGRQHTYFFAHSYNQDVFCLNVAQYTAPEEQLHTVVVCSGIGEIVEVVMEFQDLAGITSEEPIEIRAPIADQQPFKDLYKMAVNNKIDPKMLLAVSLQMQQLGHRMEHLKRL